MTRREVKLTTMLLQRSGLTFDIDWAPDWAIELCARLVQDAGATATFFVTHPSAVLQDLRKASEAIELGIHPNFLEGSSHGSTPSGVLDTCLAMVPEARSMRTHGLVQSSALFELIADAYPQIATDVSLFLPFHADLRPTQLFFGRSKRALLRLPYYWEDDVFAEWPGRDWNARPTSSAGLSLFAFHPIHIALNSDTMARYRELKSLFASTPLMHLRERDVEPLINRGAGARTFLEGLLARQPDFQFRKISDIAEECSLRPEQF